MLLNKLSTWPALRWPWFILALSAIALETIALYFQYAMGLEPCVMCIYQRVAVFGLIISALPALILPTQLLTRLLSFIGWGVSAVWGLTIAYEHTLMQNPDNFLLAMSCDVIPNFPNWLKLHEIMPAVFEARGTCDSIDWSLLGMSMPMWMTVIFALYSVALVIILTSRIIFSRTI